MEVFDLDLLYQRPCQSHRPLTRYGEVMGNAVGPNYKVQPHSSVHPIVRFTP